MLVKRPTWLTLTAAFVALGLVSAESTAAKCNAPGNPAPILLVDGLVGPSRMAEERLIAEGFHSGRLTCWNPKTGEIGRGVGLPVLLYLTESLVESTRAPIEVLLRAQEAHFSQHSRYAQSLDDLRAFGVPQDAMLEFSATSNGWSATTPRDDVAYRCFVYSGNATPELAEMKEHEVVCQTENAKASRALREIGPAAARLYRTEASAGVIQIITKKER